MYSTASDMARFYQTMLDKGALDGRRILSAAAVEVMTTVQTGDLKTGFAPGMSYGLGWAVVRDPMSMLRFNSKGTSRMAELIGPTGGWTRGRTCWAC